MALKIRLNICHRNRLFRECLLLALGEDEQMDVTIVEEPNAEAFVPPLEEGLDLLLMDASLPNMMAFRFVQTLRTTNRALRTILLISSYSPDLIETSLQAGADGCILDGDSFNDLRQAIEIVVSGRSYCSPRVAYRLFTQTGRLGQPSRRVRYSPDRNGRPSPRSPSAQASTGLPAAWTNRNQSGLPAAWTNSGLLDSLRPLQPTAQISI